MYFLEAALDPAGMGRVPPASGSICTAKGQRKQKQMGDRAGAGTCGCFSRIYFPSDKGPIPAPPPTILSPIGISLPESFHLPGFRQTWIWSNTAWAAVDHLSINISSVAPELMSPRTSQ